MNWNSLTNLLAGLWIPALNFKQKRFYTFKDFLKLFFRNLSELHGTTKNWTIKKASLRTPVTQKFSNWWTNSKWSTDGFYNNTYSDVAQHCLGFAFPLQKFCAEHFVIVFCSWLLTFIIQRVRTVSLLQQKQRVNDHNLHSDIKDCKFMSQGCVHIQSLSFKGITGMHII